MEILMKVSNKMGQYVGRDLKDPYALRNKKGGGSFKNGANDLYNIAYDELMQQGLSKSDFDEAMQFLLLSDARFEEIYDLAMDPVWIVKQRERCEYNYYQRLSRFRKKAFMENFDYLVTFTYDSTKMDEDAFARKLKKSLENMTYLYGWKYMGVAELGEQGERLHYHYLIAIPDVNSIPGKFYARPQFSKKRKRWEVITSNDYFDQYGINDFRAISKDRQDYDHAVNYICKYLSKSGSRVIYSRHLSDEVCCVVDTVKHVMFVKYNFGKQYILYNSYFWSEKRKKEEEGKQEFLIDLSENIEIDWYLVYPQILKKFVEKIEYLSQVYQQT